MLSLITYILYIRESKILHYFDYLDFASTFAHGGALKQLKLMKILTSL